MLNFSRNHEHTKLINNLHQNLFRDDIMDEERQGEMLHIFKKIEKILLDQVK